MENARAQSDKMFNKIKEFTYDGYTEFLKYLKKCYKIGPFRDFSKSTFKRFLILRHDVDASLEAALKMARIEKSLEIHSTFFVLFSHKLYNLSEKDDLTLLREISKLGHEIGLHYDTSVYKSYYRDFKETLKSEIELLESLLNTKVFSIARHNPSMSNEEDPFSTFKDCINAYDPEFCTNYVSDSCKAWNTKDLINLLNFNPDTAQLLIHPFLWTEDVCKRELVLEKLFQKVEVKNRDYKLKWLELWNHSSKVKEYDRTDDWVTGK